MGKVRETYSTLEIIIFDHYNTDYYKMVAMLIRSLAHVVSSSGGRWVGWPGQGLKVLSIIKMVMIYENANQEGEEVPDPQAGDKSPTASLTADQVNIINQIRPG